MEALECYFWRGRLSVSSKQGDVSLYYQTFWDGEVLMGKAGAPSRIYGFIGVNEFVQWCCSGEDGIGRDRMAHQSKA